MVNGRTPSQNDFIPSQNDITPSQNHPTPSQNHPTRSQNDITPSQNHHTPSQNDIIPSQNHPRPALTLSPRPALTLSQDSALHVTPLSPRPALTSLQPALTFLHDQHSLSLHHQRLTSFPTPTLTFLSNTISLCFIIHHIVCKDKYLLFSWYIMAFGLLWVLLLELVLVYYGVLLLQLVLVYYGALLKLVLVYGVLCCNWCWFINGAPVATGAGLWCLLLELVLVYESSCWNWYWFIMVLL